jgi:hypothetical protein
LHEFLEGVNKLHYWFGNPYELKITLFEWNDHEIKGENYSLIDKFMIRKDLYRRIDILVSTWKSNNPADGENTFLSFDHIKDGGVIKLNSHNPKDEIVKVLESRYKNHIELQLRKLISEDNTDVISNLLNKLYYCNKYEIKETLTNINKTHNFLQ